MVNFSGFLQPRYTGASVGYSAVPVSASVDETLNTGVETTVETVEEVHRPVSTPDRPKQDFQTPNIFKGTTISGQGFTGITMYDAKDVSMNPEYSNITGVITQGINFDDPFTFSKTQQPIFGNIPSTQLTGSGIVASGAAGMVTGLPLGAIGLLGSLSSKAVNHFHQKNAEEALALGGGAFFEFDNTRISRAPDKLIYTGQIGYSNEQMAVVESLARGFVPGTLSIVKNEDGTFDTTGIQSGFSTKDMVAQGGAYNPNTGYFHASNGQVSTFGTMQAGKNMAAIVNEQIQNRIENAGLTEEITKYGLNVRIGVADIVNINRDIRKGKYENFDDAMMSIAKDIDRQLEISRTVEAENTAGDYSADDSSYDGSDTYSDSSDREFRDISRDIERSTGRSPASDPYSGRGPGGFFGLRSGGKVGMNQGGQATNVREAAFVGGPPENFTEAETVADDQNMKASEGSFVINAPAVEYAGSSDIRKMIMDAYSTAKEKGLDIGGVDRKLYEGTIDVALSKGEVLVPPELVKIIGIDRLEKINNRGKREVSRRVQDSGQNPTGAFAGGLLEFLFGPAKPEEQSNTEVFTPETHPNFGSGFAEKSESPTSKSKQPSVTVDRSEPSEKLPEASQFEKTTFDLLSVLEGNKLEGYVPKGSKISGVTIGLGFDIGQHSISDLERMGFDSGLISKFVPYVNKKGKKAQQVLKAEPLSLSEEEVDTVNKLSFRSKFQRFQELYPEYNEVYDDGKKAILYSAYHLGALKRYKAFRNIFSRSQDIESAIKQGLLSRMNRGSVEYNRARNALDWYEDYREQNMEMPVPKPKNLSATR